MNEVERETVPIHSLKPALVGVGELRMSILAELPPLLREMGQDPDRLLGEIGLDPALFDDPENTIPFRVVGGLMEHCVARTGCRHLGLLLGQRGRAATLGVVGLLMENSPDVGTALRSMVQHLHLHDRGAAPTLALAGNTASLGYAIYEKDVRAADQIYSGSMAIACNIMRGLCGADWHPTEVLFPFRKPPNVTAYRSFFGAPLRFDAYHCALAFPDFWLKRPVPGYDPQVRRAVEALVTALDARGPGDPAMEVRRQIRVSLLNGGASAGTLADVLAMHRRTLNRRLRLQGTTFQRILDEVRFEVARQLLRDTDIPIGDIATTLGYADNSPFSRAFRRWSGTTPLGWRNGNAPRPGGN
jgi:AraC-like DNA-binding protein